MTLIKLLRVEKGLTLLDVTLVTRLRESVLAGIENRRMVAYPRQRAALAAFYEIPERELFDGADFAKLAEAE